MYLFKRVLSRRATRVETALLIKTLREQLNVYRSDIDSAKLIGGSDQQPIRLAAWTNVASVVLNLDEAITRE